MERVREVGRVNCCFYFVFAPKNKQFKIGNGWTVDIIAEIFKHLNSAKTK